MHTNLINEIPNIIIDIFQIMRPLKENVLI